MFFKPFAFATLAAFERALERIREAQSVKAYDEIFKKDIRKRAWVKNV